MMPQKCVRCGEFRQLMIRGPQPSLPSPSLSKDNPPYMGVVTKATHEVAALSLTRSPLQNTHKASSRHLAPA